MGQLIIAMPPGERTIRTLSKNQIWMNSVDMCHIQAQRFTHYFLTTRFYEHDKILLRTHDPDAPRAVTTLFLSGDTLKTSRKESRIYRFYFPKGDVLFSRK